ncbi:MAG: hypothetical protein KJ970_18135 [Candidatus Eisenbacteria bacterium]|uniref:Uncharacterized protein n=1 Tax=Eiseniibacteriota bacterium TaxID=2212470 RepID=A0A948W523_UNCEI|nr:hypothetical protein [Candidatus Eisenbacteria bacterium]MBU1951180.1 hypothetical protein [Candidatus Eisenbacteria bacterium]MBU2692842.1 hypothetical protein [Candidatus Eisenbacteria bacterium]
MAKKQISKGSQTAAKKDKTRKTAPGQKGNQPDPKATAPEATPKTGADEQVVFAFRLLRSERDLIHKVAGSAKASRFVKSVVLATARRDLDAVKRILEEGIS